MNNANSICGGGAGIKSAILINELGSVGVSRAPRLIERKMVGSCSLWLLLVALLPPVRITPAYCQHTEDVVEDHRLTFLVATRSNGSGLEIHTRFPGNQGNEGSRSQPELESQVHFIPNHSLSSECGDQYFRCQRLLVESRSMQNASGNVNNIIFIPLENGVLL